MKFIDDILLKNYFTDESDYDRPAGEWLLIPIISAVLTSILFSTVYTIFALYRGYFEFSTLFLIFSFFTIYLSIMFFHMAFYGMEQHGVDHVFNHFPFVFFKWFCSIVWTISLFLFAYLIIKSIISLLKGNDNNTW